MGICHYEWLGTSKAYCFVLERLARKAQSGARSCLTVNKCSL